jgi:gamma-glutamyltranspeptidase
MLYATVAAMIISASVGAVGAWKVQQWRMDSDEKDRLSLQIVEERELRARESRRSQHVIDAQNMARAREAKLRADADDLRIATGGLLSASEAAAARAQASHAACLNTTSTFRRVFDQCSTNYGDLAATADRHVSDIQTLIDAYPKE